MSDLTDEQYQQEYDAAIKQLDAAAAGTTPAITAPVPEPEKVAAPEPVAEVAAPVTPEPAPEAETLAELRARLEKAEKSARDSQAWGTKNAQRLAELERERAQQQREQSRPAIFDANPDLEEAIRFVQADPAPQIAEQQAAQAAQATWMQTIEAVHPGIFAADADPELVSAIVAKRDAMGGEWQDPLAAIREITAEKLAHAERQAAKRYAIDAAKQQQKSAMSVPGAGGGSGATRSPADPALVAVQRIQNMSTADFAAEKRRVMGY